MWLPNGDLAHNLRAFCDRSDSPGVKLAMRRSLSIPFVVFLASCMARPAVAPGPRAFHSSQNPKEATQTAVVALMSAGFRVTQTDSLGEAVTATRVATHNGNEQYVSCDLPRGAAAAANRETTVLLSFTAKPAQQGSDVTVASRVRTSYPGYDGTIMQSAPNETDCVSNGQIERQLESALR